MRLGFLLARRAISPFPLGWLCNQRRESEVGDRLSRFALDAPPQTIQAFTPGGRAQPAVITQA